VVFIVAVVVVAVVSKAFAEASAVRVRFFERGASVSANAVV